MRREILLRLVATFGLLWGPASVHAQQSYKVNGEEIRLEEDLSFILVRLSPEQQQRARDPIGLRKLAEDSLTAQARVVLSPQRHHPVMAAEPKIAAFRDVIRDLVDQSSSSIRFIAPAHGVIVPRLPHLKKDLEVLEVARFMGAGFQGSEPCYKYNGQTVLLQETLTARFKERPNEEAIQAVRDHLSLDVVERFEADPYMVRFRSKKKNPIDPFTLSDQLSQRADIEWAEPDLLSEIQRSSRTTAGGIESAPAVDDTYFPRQWFLQPGPAGIKIPEVWSRTPGGEKMIVAVLDGGIDLAHEDLQGKLVPGYDFYAGDADPRPDPTDAHGTACAGLIAARTNNHLGTAGVARLAKIMPLRICGASDFVDPVAVAKSILYAQQHGAKILSWNWGCLPSNKILTAIRQVTDPTRPAQSCLVITAAGNRLPLPGPVSFPARFERCIAVGAIDQSDERWNYSCYGPSQEIDLVAPSGNVNLQGDIWTLDLSGPDGFNPGGPGQDEESGNYTGRFGGTSAAAPIVAGIAALVWAAYPQLTAAQVRQALECTATKVDQRAGGWVDGRSKMYGFGKVDAQAALEFARMLAQGASPATPTPTGNRASSRPGNPPPGPDSSSAPAPGPPDQRTGQVGASTSSEPGRQRPAQDPGGGRGGSRQEQRLREVLSPSVATYEVDGEQVALTPNHNWVALTLDQDPYQKGLSDAQKQRLKAIISRVVAPGASTLNNTPPGSQPGFVPSVVFPPFVPGPAPSVVFPPFAPGQPSADTVSWAIGPPVSQKEGELIFLIPRGKLKDPKTLLDAARRGELPPLSPVYESQGTIVIPQATFSCAVDPSNQAQFEKLLKEYHLNIDSHNNEIYQLKLTDRSPFANVFAAVRKIGESGQVSWVEPDILSPVQR
jgi:subtilisin family serine protease